MSNRIDTSQQHVFCRKNINSLLNLICKSMVLILVCNRLKTFFNVCALLDSLHPNACGPSSSLRVGRPTLGDVDGPQAGQGRNASMPHEPADDRNGCHGQVDAEPCWASTCPWAKEACLLHMGCLAPFGPIDSMPIGWLPHGWLLDAQN